MCMQSKDVTTYEVNFTHWFFQVIDLMHDLRKNNQWHDKQAF